MPRRTRFAALLAPVLAMTLAACGGRIQGMADSGGPQLPAALPDTVDGNFKGRVTLSPLSQSPACPGSSIGKIEVGDRKLYFAYLPDTLFVAPVGADGSLHAASGISMLDGSLVDGRLTFIVRTPVCASSYDMHWVL